ncbi:MAG TPA: hypothetical protein VM073_10785 [Usitatibacter sp.]|nr:hypothetical protein [Usitatibacter sp.]
MHIVQLLVPVFDNTGERFPRRHYDLLVQELTQRFGGLTAYVRAPAAGLWQEGDGQTRRDDIVVYEVMVESLEPEWWAKYRRELERRFAQDEMVVRAQEVRRL